MLLVPTWSADFESALEGFLSDHCIRCHGSEKQKGDFRIDSLSPEIGTRDTSAWAEVMEKISSADMPPEEEARQPTPDQRTAAVAWIAARIKEGEAARMARRDRVAFYRLSRDEYVHSIYDLLGVHFNASDPGGFTEDPEWQGFERIGSILTLSRSHLDKYFAAAETILAEAYPDKPPTACTTTVRAMPANRVSEPYKSRLAERGLLEKLRYDLWPQDKHHGSKPGRLTAPGVYRATFTLSGLKPHDGPAPRLLVYHEKLDRILHQEAVVAPEDQPTQVQFTTHLPAGNHQITVYNDVPGPSNLPRSGRHGRKPFVSIKDGRIPWQMKLTDEDGRPLYPFLILDEVRWEGPVITAREQALRDEYMPGESDGPDALRTALTTLAQRAFRRPLRTGEIEPYEQLVQNELQAGATFRAAVKTGLLGILCSKNFLYLVEGEAEADRHQINDWELASRLSYFLWSTMPDRELFDRAAAGDLNDPAVLREQFARMLADPRTKRFAKSFPYQWLKLRKVGMFPPDSKLYPEYDKHLERSMLAETTGFFREVLEQNLSLREFIDSDWTLLNPRLARHYGIPNLRGNGLQRVSLQPEFNRGGLLTQGAILSLTSDGQRHRPVHRGVWVSEVMLNRIPPPPPANVDPVEPNPPDAPKATLRMKLEAHTSDPNCSSCHRSIDPLGFAFDNYDAIGRWRTMEKIARGTGANPDIDASGVLLDGRRFSGPQEFKQLLLADLDTFSAAFIEKLATYGLRRAITFEDRDELQTIEAAAKEADYRVSDIVEAFVLSELFRNR